MGRQEDSPSNPMAWDQGPCTTQGDKLIWNIHENTEGRFGNSFVSITEQDIQFLTFLTFYCQKSSLGFKHFICFCVKSQFPLGDKVKVDKSRASSPMQAANLHTTVFKCGTWGFQSLAISRGERIFSACLQRSVFPSTILWEVPYLAGKNSYCSAKSRKWSKLPPYFWLEMLNQVVPLTVLLFCSINIWVLPTKRNWLHRNQAWQIPRNVSI